MVQYTSNVYSLIIMYGTVHLECILPKLSCMVQYTSNVYSLSYHVWYSTPRIVYSLSCHVWYSTPRMYIA